MAPVKKPKPTAHRRRRQGPVRKGVFPFMSLPAELQRTVFEKYFEDNTLYVREKRRNRPHPRRSFKATIKSRFSIVDLLLVCKRFRIEASRALIKKVEGTYRFGDPLKYSSGWSRESLSRRKQVNRAISKAIRVVIVNRSLKDLPPYHARFANMRHLKLHWTIYGDHHEAMCDLLGSLTDTAAGNTDARVVQLATQNLEQAFRKAKELPMLQSFLRRGITVHWRTQCNLENWCEDDCEGCLLDERWLTIEFALNSDGGSIVGASVMKDAYSKCYKGKDSELETLILWQQAMKADDLETAQRLESLWVTQDMASQLDSVQTAQTSPDVE